MKHDARTLASVRNLRKQIERHIPSPTAVSLLDALLRLLGTTRWRIGAEIGTDGTGLLWAFGRGKSPRAEQIRRLTLAGADKLIADLEIEMQGAKAA